MELWVHTSDLLRLDRIRLDFLLGQDSQHYDILRALLIPLSAKLQGSGVHKPSVNLRPPGARGNALFVRIFQWGHAFSNRIGLLRELLTGRLQDSFGRRWVLLF